MGARIGRGCCKAFLLLLLLVMEKWLDEGMMI
jgi:hypothetical protein